MPPPQKRPLKKKKKERKTKNGKQWLLSTKLTFFVKQKNKLS